MSVYKIINSLTSMLRIQSCSNQIFSKKEQALNRQLCKSASANVRDLVAMRDI